MAMPMPKKRERRSIAKNRSARHEYAIEETFEAGLVLKGTEVRSLRERACQITDSFCLIRNGECWLHGVHIPPFSHGTIFNVDSDRKRKLLLHRKELNRLYGLVKQQQGLTLIPLQAYFKGSRVKIELGVCRGKKLYDKRADAAARDAKRDIDRAIKTRR